MVFIEREDGEIIVRAKKGDLMDLRGSLRWTGKPATIEEMNEAVARHLAEHDARIVEEYRRFTERGK